MGPEASVTSSGLGLMLGPAGPCDGSILEQASLWRSQMAYGGLLLRDLGSGSKKFF